MAGLDADTSSYVKAPALPAQKTLLDQVGQYQGLESGALTISKQKLDLINSQFQIMNAELSTLADPEANGGKGYTKEQAAERLTTIAKTLGFKPEISDHMLNELYKSPDVKSFARNSIVRGQTEVAKVNRLYGEPGLSSNGQTDIPTVTSPMLNSGVPRQVGIPIQRQIPPATPTFNDNNQPVLQGPTPAVTPPGTAAGPQPLPSYVRPRGDTGTTINQTPNQVVQNRNPYPAPSGPVVGMTPQFEEGKKAHFEAQKNAGLKMQAAKPAIQALPLMNTPGFLSGPLTEAFTNAVATLKSTGFIDTAVENDPTVIRQEVVKKLYNYLSNSPVGQRSDAAQTLKEAASPSPKVQLLPALIKLTKDQIALDRVEAAMPNAFKDKDFSKFGNHMATFPQSIDEKAFTLDLEPEDKRSKIIGDMAKKEKSTNARERNEASKFFKSLRMADEQGFYN